MNPLLKAIDELIKQEKPKKKSTLELPKEKRLSYYDGWSKGKSIKVKTQKQSKLI